MARAIRYLDFETLVLINREAVSLTEEKHEYEQVDEERIRRLIEEVKLARNEVDFSEAIVRKASLLAFKIASGQHFHEGNKRTALIAVSAFLRMNGNTIDIRDRDLVSVIDRAGIAAASLNEMESIVRRLVRNE